MHYEDMYAEICGRLSSPRSILGTNNTEHMRVEGKPIHQTESRLGAYWCFMLTQRV